MSGGERRRKSASGTGIIDKECIRMVVYHDGTEYGMHCTVLELDIDK